MGLRWLCHLGIHSDQRHRAVDGEGYFARCRRCGRERDIRVKFGG